VLDGRLALVDVGRGRRADFAQLRFSQRKKCVVVALERLVAQRAEGVANGLAQRGVVRWTRHDPADEDANA
jgi:hypothetical protein